MQPEITYVGFDSLNWSALRKKPALGLAYSGYSSIHYCKFQTNILKKVMPLKLKLV